MTSRLLVLTTILSLAGTQTCFAGPFRYQTTRPRCICGIPGYDYRSITDVRTLPMGFLREPLTELVYQQMAADGEPVRRSLRSFHLERGPFVIGHVVLTETHLNLERNGRWALHLSGEHTRFPPPTPDGHQLFDSRNGSRVSARVLCFATPDAASVERPDSRQLLVEFELCEFWMPTTIGFRKRFTVRDLRDPATVAANIQRYFDLIDLVVVEVQYR